MRIQTFLFMLSALIAPVSVSSGSVPCAVTDIIPTPKIMAPNGKRFVLNDNGKPSAVMIADSDDRKAAIAAHEINDRITALGGQPLPMAKYATSDVGITSGMNTIRLTVSEHRRSGDIPVEVQEVIDTVSAQGEQGYAIRFRKGQEEGETAFLAGTGWQGLLNASTTFRLLIRREGATIYAAQAQIADWPDFKYRGLPVWPLPGSFGDFKKYVDWALRYKFNRIYTRATRQKAADGFNLPTSEERRYLRKINAYAKERGIKINYALTWAVAPVSSRGKRGEQEGAVLFNEQYYTWGNDLSLRKRASKIAQFAKETNAESLLFHCIDTYQESWDKRGKNDRLRFGNDRAAADANVINLYTEEIREANPGIELQFVVYPYHINFDLPGNEIYKTWIAKLTALIPHDVYLTSTEFNRNQTDSWVAVVKQPLVHWINGNAFQWGRYFSTLPAFTKTVYREGRDRDIIIHWEPIGYFNGEVMQLVAAEYAWNVDAPGSGQIAEESTDQIDIGGANLHYRKEMVNGSDANIWSWYSGTREPEPTSIDLLLKACRLEFGDAGAQSVADFFKNNPIGWRSPGLFNQILFETVAGQEREACADQLSKTNHALTSLKKALHSDIGIGVRARLNIFLKNTYCQSLVIAGATAYFDAIKLSSKGLNSEAAQAIQHGRDQLVEIRQEMEKQDVWSQESAEWFEEGIFRLKSAEHVLEIDSSMNLLKNAGFEEASRLKKPIPHWSWTGSPELTKNSHSGAYAVHLSLRPSERFVQLEQPFMVPRVCEGLVGFWIKKDDGFRVIPMLQYWNEEHTNKIEKAVTDDFPFNRSVQSYASYVGSFRLPPHATQAVFKIYADWFGFTPSQAKSLYLDDVFVGCGANK